MEYTGCLILLFWRYFKLMVDLFTKILLKSNMYWWGKNKIDIPQILFNFLPTAFWLFSNK